MLIKSFVIIFFSLPSLLWALSPCEQANALVDQAYYQQSAYKKATLRRALRFCPSLARAHNNLALVFENEADYPQALYHYQETLKYGSRLEANYAWLGLGDVYYKQGQWPLSLKHYLHVCGFFPHARQQIAALLKDERYRSVESNQVMKADSLALILNKDSLDNLYALAVSCQQERDKGGVSLAATKAFIFNKFVFRNFRFETGQADLSLISRSQLDEMAKVLKNQVRKGLVRLARVDEHEHVRNGLVQISGHSDVQCPVGVTDQEQCDQFNYELSVKRAESIKQALIERGVASQRLQIMAYGSSRPLDNRNVSAAWAKNRRVEIEVKWK
jgi:outer membrane protein OmpA-like peptidoglycan-associated protein